jgi:ATP synthase in type III secretion protein N
MNHAPANMIDVDRLSRQLETFAPTARRGFVRAVVGTLIRAALPEVHIGQLCRIDAPSPLLAEVVGFEGNDVLLMPLGDTDGMPVRACVDPVGSAISVPAGDALLGRVVNSLGEPLDRWVRGTIDTTLSAPLRAAPPNPLRRRRVEQPLCTGVRAIDSVLSVGRGQRVGIFASAGGGKSTLMGMIARGVQQFDEADRVVVALIGERGREVRDFIEDSLGAAGLARATVVVSTSDEPPLLRVRAAYAAHAIAEHARAQGQRVVLMMDSVTRFARALRDIGLASGEPPGRGGFPPSVYSALPALFERAGNDSVGSITAFYTVLVAGDDMNEPVADETRSLLDGHIVLAGKLSERNHYPAIDVLNSRSRVFHELKGLPREQHHAAELIRRTIAVYEQNYDKISLGLFEPASVPDGNLVSRVAEVNDFLKQHRNALQTINDTRVQLNELFPLT